MKKQRHDFSHGCAPERNMAMTLVMAWFRSGTRRWQKQSFAAANFGVQKVPRGLPKGGKTGGQIEAKSLQEATCAEKAETVKIALAPLREH